MTRIRNLNHKHFKFYMIAVSAMIFIVYLFLDSFFDWTAKKIKITINTTHLIKHAKCGILIFERFIVAYHYCFTCYFWPIFDSIYCDFFSFFSLSQVVQIFSAVFCILSTFSYTCLTFSCSASLTAPVWCGLFVSAQINISGSQIWQSENQNKAIITC